MTDTAVHDLAAPPSRPGPDRRVVGVALWVGPGHLRVDLSGELDASDAAEVRRLIDLGEATHLPVVVDCADLRFIDVAGLMAIVGGVRSSPVTVRNVHGRVLRLAQLLHLDQLVVPAASPSC